MECTVSAWNLFLAQLQIGLTFTTIGFVSLMVIGYFSKRSKN